MKRLSQMTLMTILFFTTLQAKAALLPSPEKLCFDDCMNAGGSYTQCLHQCGSPQRPPSYGPCPQPPKGSYDQMMSVPEDSSTNVERQNE